MLHRRQFIIGSAAAALAAAGCSAAPSGPLSPGEAPVLDPRHHQLITRTPPADLILPPGPDGALAASRALLAAATVVAVIPPDADAAGPAAVARALGVPLFVDSPELGAELDRLQTRTILSWVPGLEAGDREVIAAPASADDVHIDGLPLAAEAPPVLVLAAQEVSAALTATLAAAGLATGPLPHDLPGSDAATTAAVRAHTGPVAGVGALLGTEPDFRAQVEVTRTAPELPGGGVAPLPGRHMIALYGHPGTPSLGMLGEQGPAAAVERVGKLVAKYAAARPDVTFMGAFEIIATVASGAPGAQGDYSFRTPIGQLLPLVEAAEEAGLYVVIDLQPGRTDFLTQAKEYADLLARPHVGLALDPEWRLKPDGRHLRSIGQVHIDEVNEVGAWLADFITEHRLPPKVLTLHQFQSRMIVERDRLDTTRPQVQYLVHVDGQGSQPAKQGTWEVIKRDLPERAWLGWKNFEDEDTPMLTPAQTVAQVHPLPHFISYQ